MVVVFEMLVDNFHCHIRTHQGRFPQRPSQVYQFVHFRENLCLYAFLLPKMVFVLTPGDRPGGHFGAPFELQYLLDGREFRFFVHRFKNSGPVATF